VRIRFKLWITDESGKVIIGKGGHQLLRKIEEKGSIAEAARELDLSYKFAWEYVRKVNERVGGLEPRKGGKGHGGTKLDERLLKLLEIYERAEKEVQEVLAKYEKELNEVLGRGSTQT
jgi:molybdate transport system regulatory protein